MRLRFMSPFLRLEFCRVFWIFGKFVDLRILDIHKQTKKSAMVGDLSDVQASGILRFKPLGQTEQLHESWVWELPLRCVPPLTCSGGERNGK
jgi:hypothetical protein